MGISYIFLSAKAFKGSMSVVKSISVPSPDTRLQPEPHGNIEAPEIKTRWKPFGYSKYFQNIILIIL